MKLISHVHESISNILTSKLRSALTLLGILVGTASVVALVSSGELATQHALAQFKTLGTDLFAISLQSNGNSPDPNNQANKLNLASVDKIQAVSPDILLAAPYTTNYSSISYEGHSLQGGIIGATDTLDDVADIKMAHGRFVSYLDGNQYFCVIGHDIAKSIRQYGVRDPIGQQIRVGNNYFTIIGVAKQWPENMFMYADINQSIIIPVGTSLTLNKYVSIQNIIFKLQKGTDIDQLQQKISNKINQLLPGTQIFPRSAKQIIESMKKQSQTFTLMLGAIGGISLIVGGIGVMNIMLVSVIERRREIGVRMAIGAKRRDIQLMFLTEAVVLALFGGVVGIIVGIGVSFLVAEFSHWEFQIFSLPPAIGFLVSAMVGIFFGFYPALKASKLNPIEVLRSE